MKAKTRDRLLQGSVGLIISVIMAFIGYRLNSYLAREILSIEYVVIVPLLRPLELPRKDWQNLLRTESFSFHLYGLPTSEQELISDRLPAMIPYEDETETIANILQEFQEEQRAILQRVTSFFDKFDELDVDDVDDFVTFMHVRNLRMDVPYPLTLSNKVAIKAPTARLRSVLELTIRTLDLLLKEVRAYEPKRTGIEIQLTVLNSGNTDGVVRPDAELILKHNTNVRIPLYCEAAQVIPKHSMATLSFWINKAELSEPQANEIYYRIEQGEAAPIRIELKDVRGAVITVRPALTLPVGERRGPGSP